MSVSAKQFFNINLFLFLLNHIFLREMCFGTYLSNFQLIRAKCFTAKCQELHSYVRLRSRIGEKYHLTLKHLVT